jgi:uncharacterized protein YpmB
MFSSCILLKGYLGFMEATAPYWETDDKDGVLGYYYRIHVENKTDETIVVYYRDGSRVGSINKNKIKHFNIYKNRYIYIIGQNSQKQYLLVMCGTDQETFIIQ